MLEILLLQSCKNNNVKFLFNQSPYDDLIKEPNIDILVDATGGKITNIIQIIRRNKILLKISPKKK